MSRYKTKTNGTTIHSQKINKKKPKMNRGGVCGQVGQGASLTLYDAFGLLY